MPAELIHSPANPRAVKAAYSSSGSPKAAAWATKLRLPRVPPGARFSEKSVVSTP
ncbi:MAG TPA: hypothetical protein VEK57_02715 [Thermoanaerobaculia bacterium]|nr:hypothetical protein [Thermoanaerobaculia bacterium]